MLFEISGTYDKDKVRPELLYFVECDLKLVIFEEYVRIFQEGGGDIKDPYKFISWLTTRKVEARMPEIEHVTVVY